jgi:hypothetical protein
MARQRSTSTRSSRQQQSRDGRRSDRSPAEIAGEARRQVEELIGRSSEGVSSFASDGNSGWVVTVEVVELERIPPSTSLIASYEARLDRDGKLVECRRVRRYARNQADPQNEEESR